MPQSGYSRDRVLRVLLSKQASGARLGAKVSKKPLTLYELSKQAGVAYSWVHKVTAELERNGWLRSDGPIRITDPLAIFQWWSERRKDPTVHGFRVNDELEALDRLSRTRDTRFAVTTYFAENAYQGYLFPRRLDAYVTDEGFRTARTTLLESGALVGGTNFRLLIGDPHIVEEAQVHKFQSVAIPCAPWPQVALDLWGEGGSAREAAELLVQQAYSDAKSNLR